ncbi:MAG: 3-hydroxyacyl-CoA dehydrogenase family protein [Chloroflexi bacterium]|nr:3-hydroxyacyl-CoA dehydrogenase family protein [Chloroflexota bacterium]
MAIESIRRVGVLGSGAMGAQIAEVAARVGGYPVVMWDLRQDLLSKGVESILSTHQKFFVEKGKMPAQEAKEIQQRIKTTTNLAEVGDVDFVVEAIIEKKEIKQQVFRDIDKSAPAHTIFATNTSYLNISDIAAATGRQDRFVGMHFFNPVAVMKLVEVIRGTLSSEETVSTAFELAKKLGKDPVICRDVSFGFVGNRLIRALRNEAVKLVADRVATPRDIDKAMRLGYNMAMGPLEMGDMTGGWAIAFFTEDEALRELGPIDGRLHPLVKTMVRAGYTGGRGKKGIYAFWDEVMSKW